MDLCLVIKLTLPIRQLQLQSYDFSCKNALVAVTVVSDKISKQTTY